MKRFGAVCGAVLLYVLLAMPSGIMVSHGARGQWVVARFSVTIPATAAAQSNCSGTAIHCAKLTWVAPTKRTDGTTITGAISYTMLRASVSGGPYTQIATTIATASYEDDTVTGGATYYYVVTATE